MTPGKTAPAPPALKVCGVTTADDARLLVGLGVELVGLNFYPRSPRCLDAERARAVRRALGDRALVVGVFVNAPPTLVADLESRVGLDLLQLHGEEPLAELDAIAERTIRVLRRAPGTRRPHEHELPPEGAPPAGWLERYDGCWGLLFDTPAELLEQEAQYGGSGRTWRYEAVAPLIAASPQRRILVAGGISPANVAAALERLPGVWGLDVCSGVESTPGRKDPSKVAAVLEAVRSLAHAPAAPPAAQSSGERA